MKVQIRFSDLKKEVPYTFVLVKPRMGGIIKYGTKRYVLFDSYFEFEQGRRIFTLCLPLIVVYKIFSTVKVEVKNADLVRITLVKHSYGVTEIKEIKVISDDNTTNNNKI